MLEQLGALAGLVVAGVCFAACVVLVAAASLDVRRRRRHAVALRNIARLERELGLAEPPAEMIQRHVDEALAA